VVSAISPNRVLLFEVVVTVVLSDVTSSITHVHSICINVTEEHIAYIFRVEDGESGGCGSRQTLHLLAGGGDKIFPALKFPRQCPVVLLVEECFREGKVLGSVLYCENLHLALGGLYLGEMLVLSLRGLHVKHAYQLNS
jgi:hypothetical protein